LVSAGYLKQIPNDPMTGKPDWESLQGDTISSLDQQETGISDVRSSSSEASSDGTAYNTW
jgi:general secretion pathway protein G